MTEKQWSGVIWIALGIYCLLGILQMTQKPGLQYDEALFATGAIHMRHLPHQEVTLPHDPDTWIHVFNRWFPLMTVRYVGAIKEYLFLPLFAIFGPRTSVVRLVSILLGTIGIWGMAGLLRQQAGVRVAAVFALLIAINPSYVDFTVFDNDAIAISMATFGLLCVALSRYLGSQTGGAAFLVGAAAGLMIWARANLVWVAAAMVAALLLLAFKKLPPRPHWIAAVVGGLVGGLPFLVYQIISRGGTWQALGMFSTQESLGYRLLARSVMFAETLLIDREHRAMWNGPAMPDWQAWLLSSAVLLSCWICLISFSTLARATALAFLALGLILFFSGQQISEHHLITLLPFAAAMAVLAGQFAVHQLPAGRYLFGAFAALYIGSALYWQAGTIRGLQKTGGVGMWSDGVIRLAQHLETKYSGREIQILDWGLQDNLYVVTDGRLNTRETFPDATREQSALHRPWIDEIRRGGVFVLNAPEHRQIAAASEGFLEAFDEGHPSAMRAMIAQRSGDPYAEVIEIEPNTVHVTTLLSSVQTADLNDSGRLEGFYQVEDGAFRWTKRQFAITFDMPHPPSAGPVRMELEIYLADSLLRSLAHIKLAGRLGDHLLDPETFSQSGQFTYARNLPGAWFKTGRNRIEFEVDKAIPPSSADGRELGIIVRRASLKQRD